VNAASRSDRERPSSLSPGGAASASFCASAGFRGVAEVVHSAHPAVKTRPFLPSLLIVALALPPQAWAQSRLPPPPEPLPAAPAPNAPVQAVQPVPYAPSQPVPYVGTPDPLDPSGVNVPRAFPIGSDFVYLKGGGIIRGTLIEAIPNDHATVELATGQSAVIPWARIERIDRNGGSSPPPAPLPQPVVPPAPKERPSAVVHIESDTPVTLERRDPGGRWMPACSSPCDEELPLASTYRISGSGVRTTNDFRLNARAGDHIVLELAAASKGAFAGGIVLTSVGGFSLLLGSMVLMVVAAANSDPNESSDGNNGNGATVGWVMVAGGAAAVLVGILVTVGNRHSNVGQSLGSGSAAAQPPRNDAWLRVPQWHDDKSGAALGVPKALGVPLFETRF
jgi:hypothetical protein